MDNITISVVNKIATVKDTMVIADNTDYCVKFETDAEWDGQTAKTMRINYGGGYTDVPFFGDETELPMIPAGVTYIEVGLYAGALCSTTPATIMVARSIHSTGTNPDPAISVYNQLIAAINSMLELPVGTDQVEDAVNDYLETLPGGVLKGDPGEPGADGKDGKDGKDGQDGANGVTFTPTVSSAGIISWTNDGGRQNPASVDLVAAVLAALPDGDTEAY